MAVVATGFFDGVHLGHRLVLDALQKEARRRGEEAVVLTFWPHPRLVLEPPSDFPGLLSTCAEREALLLAAGADRVETLPFTRDFAALSARDYLASVVRDRFAASAVVLGYDNRLGADGLTAGALSPLAAELGLDLVLCPPLAGGPVSSTRIRRAVAAGDMQQATALLGRPHTLAGIVVHGRKIGRTIGYPTANLRPDEPLQCIPGGGVYAVDVEVLNRRWKGMCNIGTRPTVGGTERTVETYIFDFDADIYDAPLRLHFLQKVRDEHRFPSLDALRVQLTRDEAAIRAVFSR
ncbi:MAG: riboflavin biosynthesis protein RibF [Bacteroidales bacterium]|nr:riboflavin biosynthesis protein RibF [Bacteroidales bacterium]